MFYRVKKAFIEVDRQRQFFLGLAIIALTACSATPTTQPTFQPKVIFYAATQTPLPPTPVPATATDIPATETSVPPTETSAPTETALPTETPTETPQPTSTSTATATPTATATRTTTPTPTATACPTETPQPTFTATKAITRTTKSTLTKTPTRPPTKTPTCRQAAAAGKNIKVVRPTLPAPPIKAPAYVPPGILYDTPRVTSPLTGERMHGTKPPLITWDAQPLMHPNDYYALYIQHIQGWNVACYKAKQGYAPDWLPMNEPHHGFGVYVIVIRSPVQVAEGAYCTGDIVSPREDPWMVFFWSFN